MHSVARIALDPCSQQQLAVVFKGTTTGVVLDLRKPNCVQTVLPHTAQVSSVAWFPQSNFLSTADEEGQTNFWEMGAPEPALQNGGDAPL